nr:DUF4335 domain-containing protein [Neosynechococcus sphagnicola]
MSLSSTVSFYAQEFLSGIRAPQLRTQRLVQLEKN